MPDKHLTQPGLFYPQAHFRPSLLKTTFIIPVSPGLTGSSGFSGTVQPQLAAAEAITQRMCCRYF